MARQSSWGTRASLVATILVATCAFGHPGSGIVIDGDRILVGYTGKGIWEVSGGSHRQIDGAGFHFLAHDHRRAFTHQRWPKYLEHHRPGVIVPGDAEIETAGDGTLLGATSFPIAIGPDGDLYYAEPRLDETMALKRMRGGAEPQIVAELPVVDEISPYMKPWKALWIHGLAVHTDGSVYYAEKEAIRRVVGNATRIITDDLPIPGCNYELPHRGGPILRGLAVTRDHTVYVAGMACGGAVFRISPDGSHEIVLRGEDAWTPTGVAVDGDTVYVLEFWFADPDDADSWRPRVRRFDGDTVTTVFELTSTKH